MARIAHPNDIYGEAIISQHWDPITGRYVAVVERADDRIGVHPDLWDQMEAPHRVDDQTLVLDTAGEYRYRLVGKAPTMFLLIFERVHDRTQDTTPPEHERTPR